MRTFIRRQSPLRANDRLPCFHRTGSSTKKTAHAVNLPSGTTSRVADAVSMTCRLAARGWRQIHLLAGKPPKLPQILAILLCHSPFQSEPPHERESRPAGGNPGMPGEG